jgi:glucosamine 6-phosphate synthetase-like amidotransferase/phosphosugar isomerase protein
VLADAGSRIEASSHIELAAAHVKVLRLPEHYGLLSPILHVVPLQLVAYHAALIRGMASFPIQLPHRPWLHGRHAYQRGP